MGSRAKAQVIFPIVGWCWGIGLAVFNYDTLTSPYWMLGLSLLGAWVGWMLSKVIEV